MKATNLFTKAFIRDHPAQAARALEHVSHEHSVAFLEEIDDELAVQVIHFFIPAYALECCLRMSNDRVTDCAESYPEDLGRILSQASENEKKQVLDKIPFALGKHIQLRMNYPAGTVGAMFKRNCPVLPSSMTVAEASRQLDKTRHAEDCPVIVVDDAHKLQGNVDPARLLLADKNMTLNTLLTRKKRPSVLVSSFLYDIENHPGWLSYRQLPVVDREGIYMGELDYETVRMYESDYGELKTREPLTDLLSLAGVYWLSVTWLLSSVFGGQAENKKDTR